LIRGAARFCTHWRPVVDATGKMGVLTNVVRGSDQLTNTATQSRFMHALAGTVPLPCRTIRFGPRPQGERCRNVLGVLAHARICAKRGR